MESHTWVTVCCAFTVSVFMVRRQFIKAGHLQIVRSGKVGGSGRHVGPIFSLVRLLSGKTKTLVLE